jgi:hypothetical protein
MFKPDGANRSSAPAMKITESSIMGRKQITAKIGKMLKPQTFLVYPSKPGQHVIVASDRSIGSFNPETGEGVLNTKGSKYHHLTPHTRGLRRFTFPQDFVAAALSIALDGL